MLNPGVSIPIPPAFRQDDGDCGWENGSNFKGNTPPGIYSGCSTLPCWSPYDNGTRAGPTLVRVAGMTGCSATDDSGLADGCVALLPIAVRKNSTADPCTGSDPNNSMCVRAWGAFRLRLGGQAGDPNGCQASNCHMGRLLGQALLTDGTGTTWIPGSNVPVVVRLTQ